MPASSSIPKLPSNPSPYLPPIGRTPRQSGEDPPAGTVGPASVASRLSRLGVEVPIASSSGSGDVESSAASASGASQSQQSVGHKPNPSSLNSAHNNSVHGSVRTSLTKFGIEMPHYPESVSGGSKRAQRHEVNDHNGHFPHPPGS